MARTKKPKVIVPGKRVGTKRSDTRWMAEDGTVWASRFEFIVYKTLKDKGYVVRKTDEQDRMAYASGVTNGRCTECGSGRVVTERHYTPDLFVIPRHSDAGQVDPKGDARRGYYLEVKGYLRADRRTLLRAFVKERPGCDLRLVVQRDYPVGKSTLVGWATRLLKMKASVWTGDLPGEWK